MGKWKYALKHDCQWHSPRLAGATNVVMRFRGQEFARLTGNGALIVRRGYAWDGATSAPDLKSVLNATLLHDVLCQWGRLLKRSGRITRKTTDRVFFEKMVYDGASPMIAFIYWLGVTLFRPMASLIGHVKGKDRDPRLTIEETKYVRLKNSDVGDC